MFKQFKSFGGSSVLIASPDILDNVLFELGTDADIVMVLRSATLNADTALAGVLVGTPDTSALAANSLIISNITSNGDILIAVNDGGHSKQMIFLDGSTAITHLGKPGTPTLSTAGGVYIAGHLEVGGVIRFDGGLEIYASMLLNQNVDLKIGDNSEFQFGNAPDGVLGYVTNDNNALMLQVGLPHVDENGSNVAVLALLDRDAFQTDIGSGGIDLSGTTKPTLALGNEASSAYGKLDADSLYILEKASADGDIAGLGQFWTKNNTPNDPFFTDDTGIDREIVTADYAGMFVDAGSSLTIDLKDAYNLIDTMDTDMPERISNADHASDHIVVGASGDYHIRFDMSATGGGTNKVYEFMVFEVATSGSAITSTTEATPCNVFASSHGFVTNNLVRITGVVTADELNDRIFTVTRTDENNFTLQDDEGVDVNSSGFGVGSNGTAVLVTKTAVNAHRKWAQADVGSLSGGCIATFTKDKILQLYVKNKTDNANITIDHCAFFLIRVG